MSDTGQLTTWWSHHRELGCGTDSKPTTPQGTGLRYWPQTVTRTMLSIMQHGRRINTTQDMPVCPWATSLPQSFPQRLHQKQFHKTENHVRHAAANVMPYIKLPPNMWSKREQKWLNPISANVSWPTQHIHNIVYSLSSIFSPVCQAHERALW